MSLKTKLIQFDNPTRTNKRFSTARPAAASADPSRGLRCRRPMEFKGFWTCTVASLPQRSLTQIPFFLGFHERISISNQFSSTEKQIVTLHHKIFHRRPRRFSSSTDRRAPVAAYRSLRFCKLKEKWKVNWLIDSKTVSLTLKNLLRSIKRCDDWEQFGVYASSQTLNPKLQFRGLQGAGNEENNREREDRSREK